MKSFNGGITKIDLLAVGWNYYKCFSAGVRVKVTRLKQICNFELRILEPSLVWSQNFQKTVMSNSVCSTTHPDGEYQRG